MKTMTKQCIHLNCREPAFEHPEGDLNGIARKSYFCMDHAWRALRGDLVLTKNQLAVFNQEGFEDYLVGPSHTGYRTRGCRDPEYSSYRVRFEINNWYKRYKVRMRRGQTTGYYVKRCANRCGRKIISAVNVCGACRRAKNMPEDEEYGNIQVVRCRNWNWEKPGEAAPGHHLTNGCHKEIPVHLSRNVAGSIYCNECWARLRVMSRQFHEEYGYPDFIEWLTELDLKRIADAKAFYRRSDHSPPAEALKRIY